MDSRNESSVESLWNEQKKNLIRVREGINRNGGIQRKNGSTIKPPLRPNSRKLTQNSSRPNSLPWFVTPPPTRSPNLRGGNFPVIPPVKRPVVRRAWGLGEKDGYDSWGEEVRTDEDDEDQYPLFVPVRRTYQPPPPPPKSFRTTKPLNVSKPVSPFKRVSYRNTPQFNNNAELSARRRNEIAQQLQRVQALTSSDVAQGIHDEFAYNSPFSLDFLDKFISECLDEEIIPDLLLEACTELESEEAQRLRYIREYQSPRHAALTQRGVETQDMVAEFLSDLTDDVIGEELSRLANQSLAEFYLQRFTINDYILDLATEDLHQFSRSLAVEAMNEVSLEDALEREVIGPEVNRLVTELVIDELRVISDIQRKKEIQEIERMAIDKIQESMCLEFLLAKTSKHGRLLTEEEHADQLLDDMVLTVLLEQQMNVERCRDAMTHNKLVHRLHEKMITDVSCLVKQKLVWTIYELAEHRAQVMLDELCEHRAEDMAELDEAEQGVYRAAPITRLERQDFW